MASVRRIVEVPVEWHCRRAPQVSMLRDGVGMFRELIRIGARAPRCVWPER